MNWTDIAKGAIPILVACIAWLLGQVSTFDTRLTKIEAAMPVLITADGVPTDSPISAAQRAKLKEDLLDKMNNLDVRISIIENEQKKK
jgi:hypothetical protein